MSQLAFRQHRSCNRETWPTPPKRFRADDWELSTGRQALPKSTAPTQEPSQSKMLVGAGELGGGYFAAHQQQLSSAPTIHIPSASSDSRRRVLILILICAPAPAFSSLS